MARLVEILDTDEDGIVQIGEWIAALRPKRRCNEPDMAPYLGVEQRNLF